ncbi:methyl-accepting chemotaxis protein [Methylomonas sp. SURF-1]|uniref:Methyl-accepting chemotaxis protein n=1 Tax=Methylomonas aurea TaxID=2952224 RepID=A0ABT1UDK3_9GAMM|nr:methyl-accepting chemotaxis protein [Methylomonas sp. SURF-1]MCQ8180207.1 methyl-accepting chemotaxis protein [Methylomonas sp. SURF-1]
MKRPDTVLTYSALALTCGCWLWSRTFGPVFADWPLLVAALLCGSLFCSFSGRRQWQDNQRRRMEQLEQAMLEYQQLSHQALDYAERRFSALEDKMAVARQTICDSTGKLSASLTGLETQSAEQRRVLRALIGEVLQMTGLDSGTGRDSVGLQKFFDHTQGLVKEFVAKMDELQDSSQEVASSFGEVQKKAARIENSLRAVSKITRQTDTLALNASVEAARAGNAGRGFGVVADEIRNLAAQTRRFSDEIGSTLQDIIRSLGEVGLRVAQAAQTDLSLAERSHENIASLNRELLELTTMAHGHSSHITEVSDRIQYLAQEGVVAIQFEDIVTQMIDGIAQETQNVGGYLQAILRLHQDRDQADGLQRFDQRIRGLRVLLLDNALEAQSADRRRLTPDQKVELF